MTHALLVHPGGLDADISCAAPGQECPFQEIQLSSYTGKLPSPHRFCIFLTHQVQLHPTIDTDIIGYLFNHPGIVDVVQFSRVKKLRILLEPIIQFL